MVAFEDLIDDFNRDGYVMLENAITPEAVESLCLNLDQWTEEIPPI